MGGEPAEEGISPLVAGQGAEPRGGLAGDRFGGRWRPARAEGAGPVLERSGPAPAWGAWRASGWPAGGRAAECGAASGVVAPRLRQGPHPETESERLGDSPDSFESLLRRICCSAKVEAQPAWFPQRPG